MVLSLEFAYFVILASLLLLCVVVAKLRDMAEILTADQAPPSWFGSCEDSNDRSVASGSKCVAATTGQPLASKGRAAKRDAGSDFDGSVGRELASDDRVVREVGIAGSEEPNGGCARIGMGLWRKERGDIDRGVLDADDDDWEGVERSESARLFSRAVRFACSALNAGLISGIHGESTAAKLYGLHKVALEGPCREHQPMAFKVSARAKWNAWQRLGNISPEVAMEEYINLLSEKFPSWMQYDAVEEEVRTDAETFWKLICNLRTVIEQQQTKTDRNRLQKLFQRHDPDVTGSA